MVVAGVLIVLGVWLYLDLRRPVSSPDSPKISEWVGALSDQVTRVEVKRPDGGFILARRGKEWRFEKPGAYDADAEDVKFWLKSLLEDGSVAQRIDEKPAGLAEFGLDRPAVQLLLDTRGGARGLQIGKAFSVGEKPGDVFYARSTHGGRLFMVSKSIVEDIRDKKAADLRDKRLVKLGEEKDVTKITVTRGAARLAAEKQGEGKWGLLAPFVAPAGADDVSTLISRVKNAEAESFVEESAADLAKYGLAAPRLVVELTDRTGAHAIRFGKADKDGKVYAAREGSTAVVQVAKFTFEDVDRQARAAELRDRTLVTLKRDDIKTVELRNAHGSTRLERTGKDEWQVASDPKKPKANADRVRQVIDAVAAPAHAHVEEAPKDLAKYGLTAPAITVIVNDGASTSQVVSIGKKAPTGEYYARGVPPALFTVQQFTYDDLNIKPAAFTEAAK